MSAVYAITNTITGQVYIGSTVSIRDRWNCHKSELRRGLHKNEQMQKDWDLYGAHVFEFSVVERVARSCLGNAESKWLARSGASVYNIKTNTSRYLEDTIARAPSPAPENTSAPQSEDARMDRSAFVTMKEAQEILGVSNYTIWQMVKTGRLTAYRSQVDRRRKMIPREDVERLKQPDKGNAASPKSDGA